MSGRHYISSDALKYRQDSRPHRPLRESPPRHHPAEDRIAVHHREIQSLLVDNQRLAATHVALKQELSLALQDLRHLSSAAGNVKADRDAEVREVYEKAVKMEAEVRLIDELSAELVQVRGDVQKLSSERKELNEKLDQVHGDLAKERSKAHQIPLIKAEIDAMHKELQRGSFNVSNKDANRAAVEYEKKVYASNIEQSQAMEKSMISMSREIEKLQAELANADKRARATAAAAAAATPGYAAGFGNHDMGYGGNAYPGNYAAHQVQGGVDPQYGHGPYDMQHRMVDAQYGPGGVPRGPYDMQHPNNAHG
ncbi:protein FLC EXPRESSOR-like isoform X2 [Cynara cardunculus var. scolymus]|uniref:protein FLC EXPRESSOR-like isoform X2 n=1 Tax=Cynara cardunculus var. scolymus TaxID=59895 RepID=UPI000D6262F1|nr:protein FLC EXPRESSOR-like isoform X2 [Cynara cardunculus var. scolymus]